MTVYKSKDIDYMTQLKKAVLKGMQGAMPQDKMYTWHYIRKQVTLMDLQTFAIEESQELVTFPVENFNAPVMVVFEHPPTATEREVVVKMAKAAGLSPAECYVTSYTKGLSSAHEATMEKVFAAEVNLIEPKVLFSFGYNRTGQQHVVEENAWANGVAGLTTYSLKDVGDTADNVPMEQKKQTLWTDFKALISYYKMN